LLEAVVIVILVLLVFMGMRSGVIIGAVLLLTICGTLIIMDIYSIAMERISLGALIIALGMLVDNAIVVTEGMLIKIQQGEDRLSAAKDVVAQTAMPLLGATVIAILAFAAIGVSQDSTGEFCRSLFQVMLISLMMSWVTAVTMTPLFCYMFLKAGDADDTSDPYGGVFFRVFKVVLKLLIKLRWLTVIVLIGGLIASGYGFKFVKKSFFPDSTSTKFMLHIWLPEGTDIRATSDVVKDIEKKVSSDDRVKTIATFIGKGAPRFMLTFTPEKSYSSYALLLIDAKDYNQIDKLAADLRKDIDTKYPNILTQVKKIMIGPGDGSKVEARFDGPDPDVLRVLAEKTKAIMRADADATGIRDDWRERVKVIKPIYDENKARLVGVYRPQLCEATKVAFDGKQIGLYREGEDLLPIISRAPESERESVNNLYEVLVWSPLSQRVINITQVVSGFDTTWEDAIIQRYNRKRTITAMCDPDKGMASDLFARLKPQIEAIELPAGYHLEWGGEYENSTKAQKGLTKNLPVSFLLMVLIIIMLFNSLKQPAVILLTVPLAVIGVTTGLLVTGEAFGFMALLGFLSLSGMLIKNAIVLIDEINLLRSQDVPPYKAVINATISRVRPVSMAAATTILGMIPLLTDAFFSSMAVTIMFGLAFATCLTLLVVPVLYAIFYKVESIDEV
jgi:multidrug efflux pump subunit AcrB